MKCELCDGTGRLIKPWYDTTGLMTGFTGDICFMCDGTGEITEETAKKTTNFDCITESPKALAEFLGKWFVLPCELCEHFRYDKCTAKISERRCDDAEAFEKWLNEESEE